MAQKNKVKELVGRGLHSYHTKALQQVDRIEKKNKEQNHKISILSNELDNDYLTKTEEGSVVSLEHSKEGMVYLDELQGNTLVNYCTDGSKEMTLNGDIDVEGVDNVYNVIIKPNTLYTVALDTNKTGTIRINLGGAEVTTTNNVAMITTSETLTDNTLKLYGTNIKCSKVRLLEGDKTNWIPSYFEGMKSSFEDKVQEDGKYGIEILSNNKNLVDIEKITKPDGTKAPFVNGYYHLISNWEKYQTLDEPIYIKKGEYYTLTIQGYLDGGYCNFIFGNNTTYPNQNTYGLFFSSMLTNTETTIKRTVKAEKDMCINSVLYDCDNGGHNWYVKRIQLEKNNGATDFIQSKSNKIQFLLDEPLRKIDDILKDKFTFKDGKLMIERNCIEKTLDGSEIWHNDGEVKNGYLCCYINNAPTNMSDHSKRAFKCNVLPYDGVKRFNCEQATRSGAGFLEFILKVNTNSEFRQKISELRPTVIVGLLEPTYEEIPFELQKIILEGYENGTLFFDTNIPPTSTVRYAGETPIVKATKLNKTEVLNNTNDINDNIIPYLMDMDYRVVCLQLATEEIEGGVSMARLFGGAFEMLKRDILSKRLTREEYGYRLADYFNAGKLTEQEVRELEDIR